MKKQRNQSILLKAIRKYYQLSQTSFAQLLDSSQSAVSKLEMGTLELSATQWINLCREFSINPHALLAGYIDYLPPKVGVDLRNLTKLGAFGVPEKYSSYNYSTVRAAWPILSYFQEIYGEDRLESFITESGYEYEYFFILSNPISLSFTNELVNTLFKFKNFSEQNIKSIFINAEVNKINSFIDSHIGRHENFSSLMESFIPIIPKYFEMDSNYSLMGKKNNIIQIEDRPHLKEFQFNAEFVIFRQIYSLEFFQQMANYFLKNKPTLSLNLTQKVGWSIVC